MLHHIQTMGAILFWVGFFLMIGGAGMFFKKVSSEHISNSRIVGFSMTFLGYLLISIFRREIGMP